MSIISGIGCQLQEEMAIVYSRNTAHMCIQVPGKVRAVAGSEALMEDGRKVRLGALQGVEQGDILEVYADIALGKLEEGSVIVKTRKVASAAIRR